MSAREAENASTRRHRAPRFPRVPSRSARSSSPAPLAVSLPCPIPSHPAVGRRRYGRGPRTRARPRHATPALSACGTCPRRRSPIDRAPHRTGPVVAPVGPRGVVPRQPTHHLPPFLWLCPRPAPPAACAKPRNPAPRHAPPRMLSEAGRSPPSFLCPFLSLSKKQRQPRSHRTARAASSHQTMDQKGIYIRPSPFTPVSLPSQIATALLLPHQSHGDGGLLRFHFARSPACL